MIFPANPVDQDTAVFNSVVYTYYENQRTWYAEGSNPNFVDPQVFQRKNNSQDNYDIVTTYSEFQKMDQFVALSKKIAYYVDELEKLLTQLRNSPQQDLDRELLLTNLIQQIQDYINHPDPDSIIWPTFPI